MHFSQFIPVVKSYEKQTKKSAKSQKIDRKT